MEKRIQKHIEYIKKLWFIIGDEEKIIWYLRGVWYYRLRKYFDVFEDKDRDFQEVINCYLFDKNLRVLSLNMIESIEVFIKNIFILQIGNSYIEESVYNERRREKRINFIEEKTKELQKKDPEVSGILKKYNILDAEIFINKLTFWEIIRFVEDLNTQEKLKFSSEISIKWTILQNWLDCLVYLRNMCSHWENIFNKNMIKTVKWRDIEQIVWVWNNNAFISYFLVLSVFRENLITNYKWEEKVFQKMKQYDIQFIYLYTKKETSPNELESEAWEVLVQPLYEKYIKKSK